MYDKTLTQQERIKASSLSFNSSPKELRQYADYILKLREPHTTTKERKEEYPIQTYNRDVTVNKRTLSFEGIVESLQNTSYSIYEMLNYDRELFLDNRYLLTEEDMTSNPNIAPLWKTIQILSSRLESAEGYTKYLLKKQIIETWQQIYLMRANNQPSKVTSHALEMKNMEFPETVKIGLDDLPHSDSPLSFYDPTSVSFLLEYFTVLKQECSEEINADMHWLLIDFEQIIRKTFAHNRKMMRLCLMKMLGYTNKEIQAAFNKYYHEHHELQYFSYSWRTTIPKMIVKEASKQYIYWYYKNTDMPWKKCITCGKWYPSHPFYFRRSKSSPDGLYGKCRTCGR